MNHGAHAALPRLARGRPSRRPCYAAMRQGFDRTDAEYVWPTHLERPEAMRLVYLDLNHWIGLAKAAVGHPDGQRYAEPLNVLRNQGHDVVVPLASEHYMEMSGISGQRQRFDVAAVMEEISGSRASCPARP